MQPTPWRLTACESTAYSHRRSRNTSSDCATPSPWKMDRLCLAPTPARHLNLCPDRRYCISRARAHAYHMSLSNLSVPSSSCLQAKKTGTPAAHGFGFIGVDGEAVHRQRSSYFGTADFTQVVTSNASDPAPATLPGRVMDVTASLAWLNASFGDLSLAISSKKERAKMRAAPSSTSVLQQTTVWTPALRMAWRHSGGVVQLQYEGRRQVMRG